LIAAHPFIAALLPGLVRSLETRGIEDSGWSSLVDAVERELRRAPERRSHRREQD
jgi:hypothetical protein